MTTDQAPGPTVGEYLDEWLDGYVRKRLATSTERMYATDVERVWRPAIGDIRLSELRAEDIQAVVDQMVERGSHPSTVHVTVWRLRGALTLARANRLLDSDPASRVRLPRRPATGIRSLSQDELARFVGEAMTGRYWLSRMAGAIALTGIRHGEARALLETDVTIDRVADSAVAGTLVIERQVPTVMKSWEPVPPKSAAGERVLPIPAELADLLEAQLAAVDQHARRRGTRRWADLGLLFPSETGVVVHPEALRRTLAKMRRDAAIDAPISTRILRHTYASIMVDAGVPPAQLREWLGHASVAMTIDVYYNATPVAREAAALALTTALRRRGA